MNREESLDLARDWAGRGVPAFPVAISWDEAKQKTNKVPLTGKGGYHNATTDIDIVEMMWDSARSLRPGEEWAVGLVPGPAGYVVLDPDLPYGPAVADADGMDGTWTVDTASGGEHRWFRKPDPDRIYSNGVPDRWAGHVDVRADGGYVVAPGVTTEWGNWAAREEWDDSKVRELPPIDLPWTVKSKAAVVSGGSGTGSTGSTRTAGGGTSGPSWRMYEPEKHDGMLHSLTKEVHDILVEHYDVDPTMTTFHTQAGDELGTNSWLQVTRPGKGGGVSGTVGFVSPGLLWVFSSAWSGLAPGKPYSAEDLRGAAADDQFEKDAEQHRLNNERLRWRRADRYAQEKIASESVQDLPDEMDWEGLDSAPPPAFFIEDVFPERGRVLLTGPAKAGKSTLLRGLVTSTVSATDFLSRYTVPKAGSVYVLDAELSVSQLKTYYLPSFAKGDPVRFLPLRGRMGSANVLVDAVRARLADRVRGSDLLMVDPLGPFLAAAGVDENDNTGVRQVLMALDALVEEADVGQLLVVHHHGHGAERSRGASVLKDWPDAIWKMTLDDPDDPRSLRYFGAFGRDVDEPDTVLDFTAGELTLGSTSKASKKMHDKYDATDEAIKDFVRENPGCSKNEVELGVKGTGSVIRKRLKWLASQGDIDIDTSGVKHKVRLTVDARMLDYLAEDE